MRWLYRATMFTVFALFVREFFTAGFRSADWETRTTLILIVVGMFIICVDSVNTTKKGR